MKKTRSQVLNCAMLGASALALAALPARATLKYQPGDYVQDGLVVHLDGIANVGADAPHNPGASVWANLADANNPAKITANSSSGWRNGSGYYFCWASAASYAQLAYATPAMTEASFEFAIDGSGSYTWGNTIFSATNDQKVCTANSTADYTFKADQWTGNSTRPILKDWSWKQASFTLAPSGAGNFKGYDQGVAKTAGNASTTGVNNIPDTAWVVGQCTEAGKSPVSLAIDTWGVDYVLLDENGDLVGESYGYRDLRTTGMDRSLHPWRGRRRREAQ